MSDRGLTRRFEGQRPGVDIRLGQRPRKWVPNDPLSANGAIHPSVPLGMVAMVGGARGGLERAFQPSGSYAIGNLGRCLHLDPHLLWL